ncbi:carbohydrate ABC transporter permease [Parasedimentitalea psychrophila]|uniref:Sugar ABC transporter permease n=1 Tax=Parasedimentitalea psychrophila TaxID=2997337 RepID=A0A9Y2P6J7_9RHOB|nr:sugar ABC transporter permease [Parasedimentitalea psychrophila]WIY24765.1 sugar ABC transporter permease [Parasedimentitalea psychrophila]
MENTNTLKRDGGWLLSGLCIFLAVMLGFPALTNIWYSVSDVSFADIRNPSFIGLENFTNQIFSTKMWDAMGFSLKFGLICTVLEVSLALMLVFVLHPILTKRPWLTALLMLPMMISPALLGVMYRLVLNEFVGIIPQYLEILGFYVNFLGPENIYSTVVVIEVLQWTPFAFLILLAARQAISPDQEEAAGMDGATPFQLIRLVLLPAMLPSIVIVSFIRFIDSFRVFDHIFVLTGGGPGNLTTSISIYIYKLFFNQNVIGEAVAVSLILLVMSLALMFAAMKLILRGN